MKNGGSTPANPEAGETAPGALGPLECPITERALGRLDAVVLGLAVSCVTGAGIGLIDGAVVGGLGAAVVG